MTSKQKQPPVGAFMLWPGGVSQHMEQHPEQEKKRGAGRLGRPGPRASTPPASWCFLCQKTHGRDACPLTPDERETAVTKRLARP